MSLFGAINFYYMSIDKLLHQGKKHFEEEAYELALTQFEAAVAVDQNHQEARYMLALSHGKLSNYEAAQACYHRLISDFPDNPDYFSARGVLHFNNGQPAEALKDLNEAARLEPDHGYRYSSRAFVKEKSGDLEGAVEDYKIAISIDPEDVVSKNNLELAEEKLGYEAQNARKFQRTEHHFTDQEIAAYKAEYEQRNDPHGKERAARNVSIGNLVKEMGKVFTSKSNLGDFLSFVKNGFRHPS